jgi:glutathione S-transferase
MAWVEIVTCLALIQYLVFGSLVAKARGQYGVKAPAVTGHEMFERFYRVQMNTPSVWLAARYWSPALMAGIASVYLVGRIIYLRSYTKDPASRGLGFMLSMGPTAVLLLAGLVGAAMAVTSP